MPQRKPTEAQARIALEQRVVDVEELVVLTRLDQDFPVRSAVHWPALRYQTMMLGLTMHHLEPRRVPADTWKYGGELGVRLATPPNAVQLPYDDVLPLAYDMAALVREEMGDEDSEIPPPLWDVSVKVPHWEPALPREFPVPVPPLFPETRPYLKLAQALYFAQSLLPHLGYSNRDPGAPPRAAMETNTFDYLRREGKNERYTYFAIASHLLEASTVLRHLSQTGHLPLLEVELRELDRWQPIRSQLLEPFSLSGPQPLVRFAQQLGPLTTRVNEFVRAAFPFDVRFEDAMSWAYKEWHSSETSFMEAKSEHGRVRGESAADGVDLSKWEFGFRARLRGQMANSRYAMALLEQYHWQLGERALTDNSIPRPDGLAEVPRNKKAREEWVLAVGAARAAELIGEPREDDRAGQLYRAYVDSTIDEARDAIAVTTKPGKANAKAARSSAKDAGHLDGKRPEATADVSVSH